MRTVAPDTFGATTALGLLVLVVAIAAWLWVLTWLLLRYVELGTWPWVAAAASVATVLTLAVGWLLIGTPRLTGLLAGDWIAYHRVTAELSDDLLGGTMPSRWEDRALFFYVMAVPHRLLGSSGFVTIAVNAAMVGTSIVLLADLTRRLGGARPAVVVAWLAALLPPIALWSGLPLREALVLLLVVAGAWLGLRLAVGHGDRPWEVVGLLASSVALVTMTYLTRRDVVPVLALIIAVASMLRLWRWPAVRSLLQQPFGLLAAAAAATTVVATVARPVYGWLDSFAVRAQVSFFDLQRGATSAIGRGPVLRPTEPLDLVLQAPGALARALWGPPPGAMLGVQPLYVIDAAFFWLLTPLLAVGLIRCVRRRLMTVWVLVPPALLWAGLSGLTLGNWGIVSRMRILSWVLLLPIVAIGIDHAWSWWQERRRAAEEPPVDTPQRVVAASVTRHPGARGA